MSERFEWTNHGPDAIGRPIWSCRREGAGFAGYGPTRNEAKQAFLDLEQELLPDPAEREVEQAIDDHLHHEAFGNECGEQT